MNLCSENSNPRPAQRISPRVTVHVGSMLEPVVTGLHVGQIPCMVNNCNDIQFNFERYWPA